MQREFQFDDDYAQELATKAEQRMLTVAIMPPYNWKALPGPDAIQTKTILEGRFGGGSDSIGEWRNDYGESALHLSVNQTKQLELLLAAGMNPDVPNRFGKTALMYAAQFNNIDSIRVLLKHGASIDKFTEKDKTTYCDPAMQRMHRTALLYAAENASLDVINELRFAGADEFVSDSQGNYLGVYALSNRNLSHSQIRRLIKQHVNRLAERPTRPMPSFSCKQASTDIELAICSSTRLAKLDSFLANTYSKALEVASEKEKSRIKTEQVAWIKERDRDCKPVEDDVDNVLRCLDSKMNSRRFDLRK